jgi:hypothetical protein
MVNLTVWVDDTGCLSLFGDKQPVQFTVVDDIGFQVFVCGYVNSKIQAAIIAKRILTRFFPLASITISYVIDERA